MQINATNARQDITWKEKNAYSVRGSAKNAKAPYVPNAW